MTLALLIAFASQSAYAQYPANYGCNPGYNAIDFSLIDFTTGLPQCMSPYPGPATTNGCTPFELNYARFMGPYQPEFQYSFGPNNYFYPFPFVNNQYVVCPTCYAPPVQPVRPLPPPVAPAPCLHAPKAGPPVVDAVDPFTVGKSQAPKRERVEVSAPNTVQQKPEEFELPPVSPTNNAPTTDSKDAFDVILPTPPAAATTPGATSTAPVGAAPRSILLPAPRFMRGGRGNV